MSSAVNSGGREQVGCDVLGAATDKPVEVPYTADYYFWKATGKPSP